jgi:hypothetical protein
LAEPHYYLNQLPSSLTLLPMQNIYHFIIAGDIVGVDVTIFNDNGDSVVLFIKNNRPVGMRYVTIKHDEFLPTISLCGNGYDVKLNVFWQNRLSEGPNIHVFVRIVFIYYHYKSYLSI